LIGKVSLQLLPQGQQVAFELAFVFLFSFYEVDLNQASELFF